MFDPNYKGYPDKFPNIIYKRKLTALPLFNQNQTPVAFSTNVTPKKTTKPLLGSNSAPKFIPSKLQSVSSPKFMSEFKTVNNYVRLCDQPFLEFSNFHFEQIFGNGSGKRKVVLDPIQKKKDKQKIQKMYTMNPSAIFNSSTIRIEDGHSSAPRFGGQNTLDPHGILENSSSMRSPSQLQVQNSIREETEEQDIIKNTETSTEGLADSQNLTHAQVQSHRSSQLNSNRATAHPRIDVHTSPEDGLHIKANNSNSERSETPTRIKKMYKIGDYEAIVGFTSLEVVLEPVEDGRKLSTRLAKHTLKRIFKRSDKEITQLILEGLQLENGKLKIVLKKQERLSVVDDPQSAASAFYMADEPYPSKKSELKIELDGKEYQGTIIFPHLDINIGQLEFHERLPLKPRYLANLFEEKFDNLQDYVENFNIPPQVYKNKDELKEEELRTLPTVIKKVIKTSDFGGLMLFKSMEISLRNTSDAPSEAVSNTNDGTVAEKIMKRRKKDLNNAQIKINIADLKQLIKCSVEEVVDMIKESIAVEEGKGFTMNFDTEKMNVYKHRHEYNVENFPEISDKFMIRFNKYLYEAYIRFPTLELYVPETNFKDVIQLTPTQLETLITESFNNMEDYMYQFQKPKIKPVQEKPIIALLIPPQDNAHTNETAKLIHTAADKLGYIVNEGLMSRPTQVESQSELENMEEITTKCSDNVLIEQLMNAQYAIFAWQTNAKNTTNQSNTLKYFLKGLSPAVKEALKDKKLFFVAETIEEAEGLVEELTEQWRAGLVNVQAKLLKNLVVVKGDEAQQKVFERFENMDEELRARREETDEN